MKSNFQVQQIDTMLKHLTLAFRHCNMYADLKEMHDVEQRVYKFFS